MPAARAGLVPGVGPQLLKNKALPLKSPQDLARHVLLRYDDARGRRHRNEVKAFADWVLAEAARD